MGVKPETDDRRAEVLSMLAQYLTGEECQTERYESFNWIPSNKAAQSSDAIKADISASALIEQNEYATPQGNICGAWWDIARILGAEAKKSASDDDLKAALDNYDFDIAEWIAYNTESKNVWSVIGSIGGTSWDFDFVMIEYSDGVRISEEIEMKLGDEFKVRQGLSWDNNYGQGGEKNGANIVVETSGTYRVQLTLGEDGSVSIELIPVE
jgi:arabinogalactan oligomer/maltooligosaccharide transport system substrate-binding protein